MEASLAVLACRSRLRADPVLLTLIVQYLLVPLPRVVLNLRRIEGRRLSPRMKKGEGKGLKTLAISPNGQLVAADDRSRLILKWPPISSSPCTDDSRRNLHAAIFDWEQRWGRRIASIDYNSILAAAIDDAGCLCTIGKNLQLVRRSPDGVVKEIGSLREILGEEFIEFWESLLEDQLPVPLGRVLPRILQLAVSLGDWFVADCHFHRVLRFREGAGVEVMEVVDGSKGHLEGLSAGQIAWPSGIAVDSNGDLIIAQDLAFHDGQLVRYSPRNAACTILAKGLHCPGPVVVNEHDIFISETARRSILKISKKAFPEL